MLFFQVDRKLFSGVPDLRRASSSMSVKVSVIIPTCGRTEIDLISLAGKVEEMVQGLPLDIKVAVMGCPVNGPGEAREADIGIAGGLKQGLIFKKGKIIAKVKEEDLYEEFVKELQKTVDEYKEANR